MARASYIYLVYEVSRDIYCNIDVIETINLFGAFTVKHECIYAVQNSKMDQDDIRIDIYRDGVLKGPHKSVKFKEFINGKATR